MMDSRLTKRLQLIQDLISLEEIDLVQEQTKKLKSNKSDKKINEIISKIEANAYGNASRLIHQYLSRISGIQTYEDPEISGLHIEAKFLEQKLADLESLKAEIEKQVHNFNIQYHQKLGHLVDELLRLRKDQLKKGAEEDQKKRKAYNEAQTEHENYRRIYEETQEEDLLDITPEEKRELGDIFRKACKLCHPDLVSDESKKEATDIFIDLKNAYDQNDLSRIKEILHTLDQGKMFGSRSKNISNKEKLHVEINRFNTKIQIVQQEIKEIKESEAYQTLSGLDDWDGYFSKMKFKLEKEIERFRKTTAE